MADQANVVFSFITTLVSYSVLDNSYLTMIVVNMMFHFLSTGETNALVFLSLLGSVHCTSFFCGL